MIYLLVHLVRLELGLGQQAVDRGPDVFACAEVPDLAVQLNLAPHVVVVVGFYIALVLAGVLGRVPARQRLLVVAGVVQVQQPDGVGLAARAA